MHALEQEPFTASESEQATLQQMKRLLKNDTCLPKLVGPQGEEIILPRSIFDILQHSVYHMLQDRAITIVPINKELTTQAAADILDVSRPYLIKLLEDGHIPFSKVGTHRRIRLSDLMDYKKQRDDERRRALAELTQLSQEYGLYD